METIYAPASGRGRAGVAVVRISGPLAHDIVCRLTGSVPPMRRAVLRKLVWDGDVLDTALVLAFAEGASFTGETSAELHLHGGMAVVSAVLTALGTFEGVRIAEPGEFTRRALENGRMELFEVEGLADLIDAETAAQRKQAQRLLSGEFEVKVAEWRESLLVAAALIEATVDFADEEIPVDVWPEVRMQLGAVLVDLDRELAGSKAAERIRNGFDVVLMGPPNVGKSTLMNRLAGRDAALTSAIPGTTRDLIEVRMDLAGLPVTIIDTAGLRPTDDVLEAEGIRRTLLRAADADLRVLVLDEASEGWDEAHPPADICVASKADLGWRPDGRMAVSAKTGEGIDELVAEVTVQLGNRAGTAGILSHARHAEAVQRAADAVRGATDRIDRMGPSGGTEFVARDVRTARLALEGMIGRIDVEEVLGAIFGRFCIGK
jgi:tRNA modification GTPase